MAWTIEDNRPNDWIASLEETGGTVSFPVASVPQLTAAEANSATGDIRKFIYALLDKFYAKWLTIAAADRPAMMTIYRSTSVNDVTGETTQTYQFQFKVTNTGTEVADES